jgi:hypothetical protein
MFHRCFHDFHLHANSQSVLGHTDLAGLLVPGSFRLGGPHLAPAVGLRADPVLADFVFGTYEVFFPSEPASGYLWK